MKDAQVKTHLLLQTRSLSHFSQFSPPLSVVAPLLSFGSALTRTAQKNRLLSSHVSNVVVYRDLITMDLL
jgi:hypothetical protein